MAIISKSADKTNAKTSEELLFRMKELHQKLMIIDYAKEFVANYKCPPIHRYYFAVAINQVQQFFAFCSLCSYLINKLNGNQDFKADTFDEPNVTVEKILKASQKHVQLAHQYLTAGDFGQKFKQGHGDEVISLLTSLVDKLWSEKYHHQNQEEQDPTNIEMVYRNSDGAIIDEDDQDNDDDDDDVEDVDDNEIELEEEFEDYLDTESDLLVQDDGSMQIDDQDPDQQQQQQQERTMIVANVDPNEWKLELERVLPQMNARFLNQQMMNPYKHADKIMLDSEWRIHLQAARRHHSNIEQIFKQTDGMLQTIRMEIHASLEKIRSKENYLHQNSSTILAEWINVRKRALELKHQLNQSDREIREKSAKLQELNEEDRQTKQSIEEFSLKITDSSPLAEAKKAKEMLKQELTRINLQIGVAVQTLVRHVSLNTSSY